jgi:AbrB family looped-hinge helix DNA binding protein
METVKVSSKGQIVIPKSMRDSHQIRTGTRLVMTSVGSELRLSPMGADRVVSLEAVAGMLRRSGARKLSDKQARKRILASLRAADEASKAR